MRFFRPFVLCILILLLISLCVSAQDTYERFKKAYARQDYARAVEYAETLSDEYPEWFYGQYLLGDTLAKLQRFEEAIAPLKKSIEFAENDEQKFQANYMLAACYYRTSDFTNAQQHIKVCEDYKHTKAYRKAASNISNMKEGIAGNSNNEGSTKSTFDGFRGYFWGDSREKILEGEGSSGTALDDKLVYEDQVLGLSTRIIFQFADDKLATAGYLFYEKHVNKNDYIDDYKSVKQVLVEKYGPPTNDGVLWKNDLYKDAPQDWGMAVSAGHMEMYSLWELEDTKISLKLHGDNFEIFMGVRYESLNLAEALKNKDLEEAKKIF